MLQDYATFYSIKEDNYIKLIYDDCHEEIIEMNYARRTFDIIPNWTTNPLYEYLSDSNYVLIYLNYSMTTDEQILEELDNMCDNKIAMSNFTTYLKRK